MSSSAEKLLERMRRSRTGWKRADLDTLYTGFGFQIRHGGSHDIVWHPDYPHLRDTLARHRKMPPVYVTDAIKLIDELRRMQDEQEESHE